jgi:acyl transferase domain-containing protein
MGDEEMNKVIELVFKNIASGKIDKQIGLEILKTIKTESISYEKDDIAITGISFNLPDAYDNNELWEHLRNGRDFITDFPETRIRDIRDFVKYTYVKDHKKAEYCKGAYLNDIDKFDYQFFGISPKEASLMDPAQKLFLEVAWKTVEDAGYGGKKLVGTRTGMFIGYSGWPMYGQFVSQIDPSSMLISVAGNISAIISRRLSFLLDLKGPSMLIDTACSSSLIALHMACESIRNGDCEQAVVGGIRIILMPVDGLIQYGIESKSYRSKTFDDDADGTSLSEGIIAMFIKPLKKALEDRDNIYAVIKGSAINQDGASVGITAPNVLSQEDVIEKAWKNSGIDPETITYIEAHGTGTKLGDPMEIDGINKAFKKHSGKKQFCAIGSIKSNMGHLDSSAGLAGILKCVLSLNNKEIVPSIHFNYPNSKINFEQSPVYVNDKLAKWDTDGIPRRCGVSSFGFSGTNCHVILEEPPEMEHNGIEEVIPLILTLSTKSKESMHNLLIKYRRFIKNNASTLDFSKVRDVCYTQNTGRGCYNHRIALIVSGLEDLTKKLDMLLDTAEFGGINVEGVYYGFHRLIPKNKVKRNESEISDYEKQELSEKAKEEMMKFISDEKSDEIALKRLGEFYVKGAEVEWEDLYRGEKRRKVSLPSYPFDRLRCWVEMEDKDEDKIDMMTDYNILENVMAGEIEFDF